MADTYTPTITGGVTMGGTATTYYIGDAVYIGGENRGFVNSSGYHPTDTTNMTVMFWLQFNSLQSTQWRTMWTYYPRWDASQPHWWIGCSQKTGDNPITPNVRIVAEDGSLNYIYIASVTSYWNYPQGVWHHVCYVKTGIAHFLYPR